MLKITDITKFTLQDYPEHTACIIWFAGCNMRCKYCHNIDIINQTNNFLEEDYVFDFLKKRVNLIDGVVLSGGECTLQDNLIDFIKKIKNLGFKIKIDTNGLNYETIKDIVEIVDFIALDFKAPFDKFKNITQISLYNEFYKTLIYLIEKNNNNLINLEIRTTVHTSLLQEQDINGIINILDSLNYKQKYYIQNFRNDSGKIFIEDQKYLLDKNKIIKPKNFIVEYRNFF